MSVLNQEIIQNLVDFGLIKDYDNIEIGADEKGGYVSVSADIMEAFSVDGEPGFVGFEDKKIPETVPIEMKKTGRLCKTRIAQEVHLPSDIMGVIEPFQCDVESALWDPGYHGKGELLVISKGEKINFEKIGKFRFRKLTEPTEKTYDGYFQGEGILENNSKTEESYLDDVKGTVLPKQKIRKFIKDDNFISGHIDLEKQLQPCSFELTLKNIESNGKNIEMGGGRVLLDKGNYYIEFNEKVKPTDDLSMCMLPRSSLTRSGATVYNSSRGAFLMVYNPNGLEVEQNSRIAQAFFEYF